MRHYLTASLTFVLALATSAIPPAHAAFESNEQVQTVDVGRSGDRGMIWQDGRDKAAELKAAHGVGSTSANLTWKHTVQRGPLGCRVRSIDVNLAVTTTLPAWPARGRATPEQQTYWDCVARATAAHEKRHAQIWKQTGQDLDKALSAVADWMPCNQVEDVLADKARMVEAEGRQRQDAFDSDERRRTHQPACKFEIKKVAGTTVAADAEAAADDKAQAAGNTPGTAANPRPSRTKVAAAGVGGAASSSLHLMLWIGGVLVAGMAGFVIFMKRKLDRESDELLDIYKRRSLLLNFARKVDRSTGSFVKRSSLPDRIGVRRQRSSVR